MSIPEAMATGLRYDVGGNSSLMKDNETGILMPSEVANALAYALSRLIRDKDLRKQLGEQCKHNIRWECMTDFVAVINREYFSKSV